MRSCGNSVQTLVPVSLCVVLVACSDGREPQLNMLAEATDLSCEALADEAMSARWTARAPDRHTVSKSQFLKLNQSEAVLRHFDEIGYSFEDVRSSAQPVPRVYLSRMPADLDELDEIKTRKQLFLAALLPAILQVNEEIRESRRRLAAISSCQQSDYPLARHVRDWIDDLAAVYRSKPDVDALLLKVAEIPPSMALAQAAVESGWGMSEPAQTGNSLFGQYMVEDRGPDKKPGWRLASFETVLAAVRSYANNLNIHPAYREFRAQRAKMLLKGQPLDGMRLIETLTAYSKRRANYIRDVQVMIRRNDLRAFDQADLVAHADVMASENFSGTLSEN